MGGAASKNIAIPSETSEQVSLKLSDEKRAELKQAIIEIFRDRVITKDLCDYYYQLAKEYNTDGYNSSDILIPANLYIFKKNFFSFDPENIEEIVLLSSESADIIKSSENTSDINPSQIKQLKLPLPFWVIFKKCESADFDKNNLLLSEILNSAPTESQELGINILHFCSILGDYKSVELIHQNFPKFDDLAQSRTLKNLEIRLVSDVSSTVKISYNSSIIDICSKMMSFLRNNLDLDVYYDSSKDQIFANDTEKLEECQEKFTSMETAIADCSKIISIVNGTPIVDDYQDFSFEEEIYYNSKPSTLTKADSSNNLFGLSHNSIFSSK